VVAVFCRQLLLLFDIDLDLLFLIARQVCAVFAQERSKENEKIRLGDVGVGRKEVGEKLNGGGFVSLVKQRFHLGAERGIRRAVVESRKGLPLLEWRFLASMLPGEVKKGFLNRWGPLLFAVLIPKPRHDLLTYQQSESVEGMS